MPALTPDIAKVETTIVEMTNAFRKEHKLAAVTPNPRLAQAARAYAEFLAQSNLFSHTADGRQHSERIRVSGYEACATAENLSLNMDSRGFESRQLARDAIEGWKKSPGHRRNMMNAYVTEIGVGTAKARNEQKFLSVQLFGRPKSLAYKFRIDNDAKVAVDYSLGETRHVLTPRQRVVHTICTPVTVTFERVGSGRAANTLVGRYDARDGHVYVLRSGPDGAVSVDVRATDKLSD